MKNLIRNLENYFYKLTGTELYINGHDDALICTSEDSALKKFKETLDDRRVNDGAGKVFILTFGNIVSVGKGLSTVVIDCKDAGYDDQKENVGAVKITDSAEGHTWNETLHEFFKTLGDKYKPIRNEAFDYIEDINQNPKNFTLDIREVDDHIVGVRVKAEVESDATEKLQAIINKAVKDPNFETDFLGEVHITDAYHLADMSIDDKGKKKYEGLKRQDEYEIFLGALNDDKFTWYSVGKYNQVDKAYKEFKSYVNTQLKYTDEELKRVWESGRLDVELRQGNRLLNWVGIYSREVTKLTRAEEHAVQGGKKKRGKPMGAKKFQIAKVHGIAKDSSMAHQYRVDFNDSSDTVESAYFYSSKMKDSFINSLDTDLDVKVTKLTDCDNVAFPEAPCKVICISTGEPKQFMSVEEALDFVSGNKAVARYNNETEDDWSIVPEAVETTTPEITFDIDGKGNIWIEQTPESDKLIERLQKVSENETEVLLEDLPKLDPNKNYITVYPDDPYYNALKKLLHID